MLEDLQFLSESRYLSQRLNPQPGQEFYIPLSDTLIALNVLADFDADKVLDFGCGGSPYQSLFNGKYIRADISLNPDRDITIGADSCLPADVVGMDHVISTQVLEHVEDPDGYLEECRRVLRSEGVLFLSTHGLYEDHGSPDDFWRWTASGLRKLVERNGFAIERLLKLTCGPRSALFSLERDLQVMGQGRRLTAIFPPLFAAMRWAGRAKMHRFSDGQYASMRVCDGDSDLSPTRYVGLAMRARRIR